MKNLSIEVVRNMGHRVSVTQFRYLESGGMAMRRAIPKGERISPRGGQVHVKITTFDNKEVEGVANCSPLDNFRAKYGLMKALGRAYAELVKL